MNDTERIFVVDLATRHLGAWETVSQLARELEARRKARSAAIDLGVERAKRGGRS